MLMSLLLCMIVDMNFRAGSGDKQAKHLLAAFNLLYTIFGHFFRESLIAELIYVI